LSAFGAVDELYEALDDRTIEILKRRRGTSLRTRGWMIRRALLVADLVGLSTAFVLAQQLYGANVAAPSSLGASVEFALFALSLPGWVVAAKLYGLYDRDEERTDHSTADDLVGVFHLITVCSWGLLAVIYVTRVAHPELAKLLTFWAIAIAAVTIARGTARTLCRRQLAYLQNTVIVGAGDTGQLLALKLLKHPEYGLNLVGFIDANPKVRSEALAHLTLLGDLTDLPQIIELLDVERVIIAFTEDSHQELLEMIAKIRSSELQIDIVPRLFDNLTAAASRHLLDRGSQAADL
jgi:FlaA1/EpsC-like NDP-sugar epimerase